VSFWSKVGKYDVGLGRKKRIAFDVEGETLEQIDDLLILTGAPSRAELFRDSLRLFAWMTEQENAGYEILLRKNGEDTAIKLKRVP
jgi:hypothetical protein